MIGKIEILARTQVHAEMSQSEAEALGVSRGKFKELSKGLGIMGGSI